MSGGGGENEAVVEEEEVVVHMDHLVRRTLPRRATQEACLLTMEKQRTFAQTDGDTPALIEQWDGSSENKAPYVDHAIKNGALKRQNMEMMENSGGITENNTDQIHDLLQLIRKIRDEIIHKERVLQERSIQCDMDIQTILNGRMTPKVLSIVEKYKGASNMTEVPNSSCSGDGGQTMSSKRKRLKKALDARNKCQELDKICDKCEWILPTYTMIPSVADGMFYARVYLTSPNFDMDIGGHPCPTPREARCSAAANMIAELKKAEEEEERDTLSDNL